MSCGFYSCFCCVIDIITEGQGNKVATKTSVMSHTAESSKSGSSRNSNKSIEKRRVGKNGPLTKLLVLLRIEVESSIAKGLRKSDVSHIMKELFDNLKTTPADCKMYYNIFYII